MTNEIIRVVDSSEATDPMVATAQRDLLFAIARVLAQQWLSKNKHTKAIGDIHLKKDGVRNGRRKHH